MGLLDDIKRDREAGTPGPWRVSKVNPSRVFGADSQPVIVNDPTFRQEEKFCANARRIARVPDMEAALIAADELARAGLDCHLYVEELRCGDELRDALRAYRAATGAA